MDFDPTSVLAELLASPETEPGAVVDRAWARCLREAQNDPLTPEFTALDVYKHLVRALSRSGDLPRSTVDTLLEDFRSRCEAQGYGPRTFHRVRMTQALVDGELERAGADARAWQAAAEDELHDCGACERSDYVDYLRELERDQEAVEIAQVADPPDCAHEPGAIQRKLLLPLVRLQRFDEAQAMHEKSFAALGEGSDALPQAGYHLAYVALFADPRHGLELIRRFLPAASAPNHPADAWRFWAGAWLLCARQHHMGTEAIELWVPDTGEISLCPPGSLAGAFLERLNGLATYFDARNANDYREQCIRSLAERVPWPAVPST